MALRKLVAGNWKMHGLSSDLVEVRAIAAASLAYPQVDVALCVPAILIERAARAAPGFAIAGAQLDGSLPAALNGEAELAIAYEPIWAIGTGKIPTIAEIAEMHAAIRASLVNRYGADGAQVRILYGGSVKPSNAGEIFAIPDVDGALVGGASLKAADFIPIVEAAAAVEGRGSIA